MKRAIIIFLVFLSALPIFASFSIGFDAGYSMGILNQIGGERAERVDKVGHSFTVSIPVRYEIHPILSINSGIRYSSRGYEHTKNVQATDVYDHVATNHYLEIPLTLRIEGGKEDVFKGFIGVGGYVGILFLKGQHGFNMNFLLGSADGSTYSSLSWPDTSLDNLFSAGLILESGMQFALTKDWLLTFVASYDLSLTDAKRSYRGSTPQYLDSFTARLGVMYRLGGNK